MKRKRHSGITDAEAALGRVFQTLQLDDAPLTDPDQAPALLRRYRAAFATLVLTGPLLCLDFDADAFVVDDGRLMADEDVVLVRAELLQLYRSTVRGEPFNTPSSNISTYRPISFTVATGRQGKVLVVRGSDLRDVIVLQSVLLLQSVGLPNVHLCAAPDCGRYFVKVYRREFCSMRCQKRINTRKQRQLAKELRERRARQKKGTVRHG